MNDAPASALALRHAAEEDASAFPPLLVEAQELAGSVMLGEHGRRRSGTGDDFWQYRPLQQGDSRRMIDHRMSAKGDQQFVREREWQIAQTIHVWSDLGASMRYTSQAALPQKIDRARLLTLAASILMIRAGERVGLTGGLLPPRRGNIQVLRLAEMLSQTEPQDYTPPEHRALIPHARALFVSDFLGPFDELQIALGKAADRGVRGVLLQVLDPSEVEFDFQGRTRFQSINGGIEHETLKASALRTRYIQRLEERRKFMDELCQLAGWRLHVHRTDHSAQSALMWLFETLQRSAA
ncbi:DUF58 domain-containing protein [Epibacterium ulvae]|uniref:DUF58 domain-containing protein n=1 Tax=Epibacterium ulvae TaxID=1156985 RepID=UPI002492506A|nr:DUF58 domain-containing protein [Epibacterium ulvae]